MISIEDISEPTPVSKTVHGMASHIFDQAQMLMMDISQGTHAASVESRLGCIVGAVLQLENLLEGYRRIDGNLPIHNPSDSPKLCNRCRFLR